MGCGLIIGIVGPLVFTGIVLFRFAQETGLWPLLFVAVISWTGVLLTRKRQLIAGIIQILLSITLPVIFLTVASAISPQWDLGAGFSLFYIIIPLCSLPLLISGSILIISRIGER